jgi:TfoX/Sxy family transcriptional regulator of competence genes
VRQGKAFVLDVLDMLYPLNVRERAMFGAYGVYCDEKFVMIIGDDQVFIKRSDADPSLLEGTEPAPPYEGSTDWHLVPEDMLRETGWLRDAVQATADALPPPKPKKTRKTKDRPAE